MSPAGRSGVRAIAVAPLSSRKKSTSRALSALDAGTGTNALNQARHFNEAVEITGITITKLDGTARGGMLFAIASELGTPIRFIGVGESAKDLRPFDAGTFINAILPLD